MADLEYWRKEAEFWREQYKLAANVAATIADLDEEAPALRQMLRTEREHRESTEAAGTRGHHDGWTSANDRVRAELDRLREIATARLDEWPSSSLSYWQSKGVLMAVKFVRRVVDDEPTSDTMVFEADEDVDRD